MVRDLRPTLYLHLGIKIVNLSLLLRDKRLTDTKQSVVLCVHSYIYSLIKTLLPILIRKITEKPDLTETNCA